MAVADKQTLLFANPSREGLEASTKLIGTNNGSTF
jgi:hypothetical protein